MSGFLTIILCVTCHYFSELKSEATKLKRWELCRDADLYSLKHTSDQEILNHLVYGTPHTHYQTRVAEALGITDLPPYGLLSGHEKKYSRRRKVRTQWEADIQARKQIPSGVTGSTSGSVPA